MCCHALVLFVGLSQLLPLQRVFFSAPGAAVALYVIVVWGLGQNPCAEQ